MPSRIALFVIHNNAPGIVRVLLNLAAEFHARGHAVQLVSEREDGFAPFAQPAGTERVVLPELPPGEAPPAPGRPGQPQAPARRLARYLEAERPDAILAAGHPANLAALRARQQSGLAPRVVVSTHMTLSAFLRGNPQQLQRMALEIRNQYPQAEGIVAVSRGVADDLAQVARLPRERIEVIPNPAPVPPEPPPGAPPPHPWLAPGEPPVLLGSGRLAPQKDFITLLRAFAQVRQARPEAPPRLIVLGDGPERERLLGIAAELGVAEHVAFPGFVADPFAYLRRAALFVLSSIHEGLPNVLLEALACGIPCVSTDCPSGPREILQEGALGLLVPVRNAEALAQAILETLAHPLPAGTLRQRGADFAPGPIAARYLERLVPPR